MSDELLPSIDTVKRMLQCLLGDGVQARVNPAGPDLSIPYVLATYVNDAEEVRRVVVCDLNLANSVGAAFSMIPAAVAADATSEGLVTENIRVNLYEVLNVCVNLFTEHTRSRLTLGKVEMHSTPDAVPPLAVSAQFLIQVPRYASGILLAGALPLAENAD